MDEKPITLARVRLTDAFVRILDGVRPLTRVDPNIVIRFLSADNLETGYEVKRGFYMRSVSDGTGGTDKEFLLYITDRPNLDSAIYEAWRFQIGDQRYERVGHPSSPTGNPAFRKIAIKPVSRRTV